MIPKPNPLAAGPAEARANPAPKPAESGSVPLNVGRRAAFRAVLKDMAEIDERVVASFEKFDELDTEAKDFEIEPPSEKVKQAAFRILVALAREFPRYYAISPGEGREVAIEASAGTGKGRGILIVCDDEDIHCYVTMNGKSRWARYDLEDENLPDSFIRDAIRELG